MPGECKVVEAVKQKWKGLLTEAGYQRVVFLRGSKGMRVDGLPVLASAGAISRAPIMVSKPSEARCISQNAPPPMPERTP